MAHPWRQGAAFAGSGITALVLGAVLPGRAAADPPLQIKPGIELESAAFLQDQSWFGQSEKNVGVASGPWAEAVATPSLDWTYDLSKGSAIQGRLSAIAALTAGADATGDVPVKHRTTSTELEDAYLEWRSGDLLGSALGTDAIDISIGRRKYQVGSGFLFWKESSNGASRAAEGIAPRKAARMAATTRLSTHGWQLDTVYLEFNDKPSTHTRLIGSDLAYSSSAWGQVGVAIYKFLDSDKPTRAGMRMYDVRGDTHLPLPGPLHGVRIAGEYVRQDNGRLLQSEAGFVSLGYAFDAAPWAPYVGYRRARFSGDNPRTAQSEAYDPLAIGISNWGSLVISKYVQSNTNLQADVLRLTLKPERRLDLTVETYRFILDHPPTPAGPHDFADELDATAAWSVNKRLTLSAEAALAKPLAAAVARTGGDELWSYLILDARVKF